MRCAIRCLLIRLARDSHDSSECLQAIEVMIYENILFLLEKGNGKKNPQGMNCGGPTFLKNEVKNYHHELN